MILNEGGSMPGVGPIHIDEIDPTLTALEKALGIDLKGNVLGSVGKKTFSGDIDVALQLKADEIPDFMERLKNTPEVMDMAKSSVIMTKVKIVNFDQTKTTDKPRTGFVQVDFMPGDPGWLKTYYHSPSETDDGRPMESERFLWSPTDGLVRVKRTPVPKKTGEGYTKKNNNEIIAGPWKTPQEIARVLKLDGPQDLNSYESLRDAIKKNYPKELTDKILQSFADNKQVQDIGIPDDIKELVTKESKELNRIKELAGL